MKCIQSAKDQLTPTAYLTRSPEVCLAFIVALFLNNCGLEVHQCDSVEPADSRID